MKSSVKTSNAIIVFGNKFLLMLRDDIPTIFNPNTWSLIGGVVEKGESFMTAMKREMDEEINVVVADTKYLGKMKSSHNRIHAIYLSIMTEKEKRGVRLGNEGQKVDFFTMEEMKKLKLAKELTIYISLYGDYLEQALLTDGKIEPQKLGLI